MEYQIRHMSRDEVDLAVEWAAGEGWNPGWQDAACFYFCDPQGFLIGTLDGEPVGSISAVTYGEDYGFLGFYIVRPEYRGQGYGIRLWNAAMERLGNRLAGLDGVVAQQHNYRKSGFEKAFSSFRFEASSAEHAKSSRIVALSSLPLAEITAYDALCFPAPREAFIKEWIKTPGGAALGFMSGSGLAGYGVIRACRNGYKIGPLFADSDAAARELFDSLAGSVKPGCPVFLDVPEMNGAGLELAQTLNMRRVFETARMYRGPAPATDTGRVFGITTFELG